MYYINMLNGTLEVKSIIILLVVCDRQKYKIITYNFYQHICLVFNNFIYRHLLMCRVTLGKSFIQYNAIKIAHAPPGHHSVMGTPSVGGLNFSEYVVYRGEQV